MYDKSILQCRMRESLRPARETGQLPRYFSLSWLADQVFPSSAGVQS
jgi:hypothetical protein